MSTLPLPTAAAIGLAERLALHVLAVTAPWSSRSQHDCWLAGWTDGSAAGYARGVLAGRREAETP